MPTQTHPLSPPGPVALLVRAARGSVVVDTTATQGYAVELSARDEDDLQDVRVRADEHRVEVEVPKRWFGRQPKIAIVVRVPAGSTVDIASASASIDTRGELGAAELRTSSGSVHVDRVTGDARVDVVSGGTRIDHVGGRLVLHSVSGSNRVGTVEGDCSIRTVSGSTEVGHAGHDLEVTAVSGGIRARNVQAGSVDLKATSGSIQVGVQRGTLVWLDLRAASGSVRSDLDDDAGPAGDESGAALELRAHTTSGSIRIERSTFIDV